METTLYVPQNLPFSTLEGLYELLVSSVRDMLYALDSKQDNMIVFNALKKQVEVVIELIEDKQKEAKN